MTTLARGCLTTYFSALEPLSSSVRCVVRPLSPLIFVLDYEQLGKAFRIEGFTLHKDY